ncbi:MAG: porin [Hyphomicrobiales bacterium]
MTLAKRLLLGSAAAVVATTGAQAADLGLPVAPAVDYVQICSIGSFTGFILPGSDVCFDISGFARFQAEFHSDIVPNNGRDTNGLVYNAANGIDADDEYNFMGVGELNFDARTMTEWGLLRGFIRIDSTGGNTGDGGVLLQKAFVQIGGLTAGYTDSFFDPVYTDYALGPVGAPDGGAVDLALIGYAYAVGNGVTIMASLEESDNREDGAFYFGAPQGGAVNPTGLDADDSMPDVVLAVRVDQAWGSAKLSGAVHEVDVNDSTAVAIDSEFGFAVGASAEFNLPIGYDSEFGIFGTYTSGALDYAGAGAFGVDAVVNGTTGSVGLTTAYALGAGFEFGLTSMLDLELDAYYASIDHDTGTLGYDADSTVWSVRGSLAYRPITNLEIRAGIGYTSYDDGELLAAAGGATGTLLGAGVPAAVADTDDAIGATFRITRSF